MKGIEKRLKRYKLKYYYDLPGFLPVLVVFGALGFPGFTHFRLLGFSEKKKKNCITINGETSLRYRYLSKIIIFMVLTASYQMKTNLNFFSGKYRSFRLSLLVFFTPILVFISLLMT